jgi:hypothetical protein
MTTEYLRGEVLYLLDWAQQVTPARQGSDRTWRMLREEAETARVDDLSWVVERALAIAEADCWSALVAGEAAVFRDRARLSASLYDFGICSNLLPLRNDDPPPAGTTIWRKGHRP